MKGSSSALWPALLPVLDNIALLGPVLEPDDSLIDSKS